MNPSPKLSLLAGYALLFSGMALVGAYTALSKPLSAAFPVFLLAWLRFAIAAVVMIPWMRRPADEAPLDGSIWRTLFTQSFFGNFLFSIFMLSGVALTSASAAGVVMAALPPLVALLSWWLLGERAGLRVLLATGLAAASIALLSPSGNGSLASSHLTGNLLILACAACEAVYVILGKRLSHRLSPRRISALINLIGLALMTPLGLWQAIGFDPASVPATSWWLLIFYSIAASMISTWLWLSGLTRVPAAHSGVFTVALPLAATAVAVGFLGEPLGWNQAIALAFAVTGIALVAWPARAKRARE